MNKIFSIYRSSAGSGKTRTLAKEYLKLALQFKAEYFKHILAVTFTNKASQEMKTRILAYLDDFAKGADNELALELKKELKLDDQTFQQNAQEVQRAILHQYSQFSISTIDAFFQKVIRSFTRESGLIGDYRLEVDHDAILEEAIDNLIDELGSNKELTEWVVEFAKENLENERAWDVRFSLIQFAKEIFREEFKAIEDEVGKTTSGKGFFKELQSKLWATKNKFLQYTSAPALEALQLIQSKGWSADDFYHGKNSGLITFFKLYADKNIGNNKPPSDRLRVFFSEAANWPNKKTPHKQEIFVAAETTLAPALKAIIDVYDELYTQALSSEVVIKNLYVFGLISDIARKLKEYKDENNVMLLADAPKFLNGIIQDSDTPFIYEKVGSFYRNYLIDEFQDTSGMQWKNFQPLIVNALDQGYPGLVVGDVKQAIYRWRGGDLNLLQRNIAEVIGDQRVDTKELSQNFRSCREVVEFNNALFETAARIIATHTGEEIPVQAYQDIVQKAFKTDNGFVDIRFIEQQDAAEKAMNIQDEEEGETSGRWSEVALDLVPETFEKLQAKGVRLKDIAILVRKNEEGQRIAAHLLNYKASGKAKASCRYDVVSNESLRIDGATSVNLILGAMRYLLNSDDSIARAQLAYEFARVHELGRELTDVFAVANQINFENNLPERFRLQKTFLKKLPLIELTETLIETFDLGRQVGELVYLQAFQDLVLEFSNRARNDLGAFLEWWEDNRHKKSVQISGDVDAAQILTIHKSKGLQFKYVIIPFCSWKLNHEQWQAPNLWVPSELAPFENAGYVPVKYGNSLEQTYFASYYKEERTKTYLDNLNLLYVAFTRAEQGLIVTAPHLKVKGAKDSVAGLLAEGIMASSSLEPNWKERELHWSCGSLEEISQREEKASNAAISLREYVSSSWREKIVIRQSSQGYFNTEEPEFKRKINAGIHMHEVLSRMKYATEIDETIERILHDGLITIEEKPSLKKQLEEILSMSEVAEWFSSQWEVRTEVPILLPSGGENRIDRLITSDGKAIVIDFKTGAQNKSDNKQVMDYMSLLRQMNYVDVKGFLLYLKTKEVVEVRETGSPKIVKGKKDKSQLSLGI